MKRPSNEALVRLMPALVLVVLALLPAFLAPREVLTGWLAFSVFLSTLLLGGFFFLMLTLIIPGGWSGPVRPAAAQLSVCMPLLALSLVPVLLATHIVFPWSGDETLAGFREFYLSPASFIIRTVLILLVLLVLNGQLLRRGSRALAIWALLIFMLVQNLMATDLVLSLDPDFHSSGFGLYLLSIQALTGFSAIVWLRLGGREGSRQERRVLGALLLVLLLCWAYFTFMQYFILWSGNLPSRAAWYERRESGVWLLLERLLATLRLLPAFLMLFTPFRQGRTWLLLFSALSMLGTLLEIAWLILPELHRYGWGSFAYLAPALGLLLLARVGLRFAPEAPAVPTLEVKR
jgi:hypothetical protein